MIVTRTPLRICLGGGGTDVKDYYHRFGGYVVSAALNQYIYIVIHKHFEKNIRLCYSKREIVNSADEVRHPVAHEVMKLFNIEDGGFEIISFADIPSDTGLGTSSSFTVGLIAAMAAYKGVQMTKYDIAEMACHVERELLKEAGGKQDQYIAAFGGITSFTFDNNGKATVSPVHISHDSIVNLEQNIIIFFTGITRNSPRVQQALIDGVNKKTKTLDSLHNIKQLGYETEAILSSGNLDKYADILKSHWESKRKLSSGVSNDQINDIYRLGIDAGALGGKLIGAGGGGYLLFYCPDADKRQRLRALMQEQGLSELKYKFDFNGTKVLIDDRIEENQNSKVFV